jgi:RNA polymerase sigma factor (sigma-70 family)
MRDARDAEDALLLETGDHAGLLAAWHDVIVQRCLVRVRSDAAYDVAQDVCERLLRELQRGKRYPVPYRVVVHQVVTWTIKDYFAGRPTDLPLPEGWDPAAGEDAFRVFEEDYDLERLFAHLPEGDRAVADLRYREGLEVDQIAERLHKEPNAVHQALWRAHSKLKELVRAA